jgi:hypothetical protein
MIVIKRFDLVGCKGYIDDILANSTVDGDNLIISYEKFFEIKTKYKTPSAISQAKHLIKSLKEWAASGLKVCNPKEVIQRSAICKGCKFFKDGQSVYFPRCTKCGCTNLKNYIKTTKCPIGKW